MKRLETTTSKRKLPRKFGTTAGFTLIELSIAMVIISVLGVMFMREYVQYVEKVKISNTDGSMNRINIALQRYAALYNGYPLPARLDLQEGDLDYGAEGTAGIAPELCTSPTWLANDGYCITPNPVLNPVLIGGVPFQELQLTEEDTLDYWNRKILYAVSVNQTQPSGTFNDDDDLDGSTSDDGSITVQAYDETLPWGTLKTAGTTYDFVLISGGETGVGAFRNTGTQNGACPGGTPQVDDENCNFDDIFILEDNKTLTGTRTETSGFYGTWSLSNNANFYDDLTFAVPALTKQTWYRSQGDPNFALSPANRVGIGTQTPQARLHVEGNVKADNILSDSICDSNATYCFNPEMIAGDLPEMDCEGSDIVVGENPPVVELKNSQVNCGTTANSLGTAITSGAGDIAFKPGIFGAINCKSIGQLMQGVDAAGNPICVTP